MATIPWLQQDWLSRAGEESCCCFLACNGSELTSAVLSNLLDRLRWLLEREEERDLLEDILNLIT